ADEPLFGIAPQPSEAEQIDLLTIYDDGRGVGGSGTLSPTGLSGFGLPGPLLFDSAVSGPQHFPGGISFAALSVDGDGATSTDSGIAFEVISVLLGRGDDHLEISGTALPAGD